jgi:hypothetical protein
MVRLLNLLEDQKAGDQEIENAFKSDPSLSYKLLRIANSAAFGGRDVTSIGFALRMVGRAVLHRWLTVLLVSSVASNSGIGHELVLAALVRARLAELVAERTGRRAQTGPLFLVGLFSLLDALLRMPMEGILSRMAIAQDVKDALLTRSGPYASTLALVEAQERGDCRRCTRPRRRWGCRPPRCRCSTPRPSAGPRTACAAGSDARAGWCAGRSETWRVPCAYGAPRRCSRGRGAPAARDRSSSIGAPPWPAHDPRNPSLGSKAANLADRAADKVSNLFGHDDDDHYRTHHERTFGARAGRHSYDQAAPAYEFGHTAALDERFHGPQFDDAEPDLRRTTCARAAATTGTTCATTRATPTGRGQERRLVLSEEQLAIGKRQVQAARSSCARRSRPSACRSASALVHDEVSVERRPLSGAERRSTRRAHASARRRSACRSWPRRP